MEVYIKGSNRKLEVPGELCDARKENFPVNGEGLPLMIDIVMAKFMNCPFHE